MQNRTMPDCTILPVLSYDDVEEAIDWLCKTFGFQERWRVANHRAQLSYYGGVIVVTEGDGRPGNGDLNSTRHSLLVRVTNIDQHFTKAAGLGAVILQAPADYPFGERQYTVNDIGGHRWTFSQSIKDLAPEDWGGTTAEG